MSLGQYSITRVSLNQVLIHTKCQRAELMFLVKNLTRECLRGELGAEPRFLTRWIPKGVGLAHEGFHWFLR